MAITVINNKISAFNVNKVITATPATSTVINTAEVFTVTPTSADYKTNVVLTNGAGHGAVAVSIPAGDQYGAGEALTFSIADGKRVVIELEAGKYMNGGAYAITVTPATGKRLLTDHAFKAENIESL